MIDCLKFSVTFCPQFLRRNRVESFNLRDLFYVSTFAENPYPWFQTSDIVWPALFTRKLSIAGVDGVDFFSIQNCSSGPRVQMKQRVRGHGRGQASANIANVFCNVIFLCSFRFILEEKTMISMSRCFFIFRGWN